MARIPSIFNTNLPMSKVIIACAIEPDCIPAIKALNHTGKRGRPSKTVNGKAVHSVLTKAKAPAAMAAFKELF
jgi:hypothetical protein